MQPLRPAANAKSRLVHVLDRCTRHKIAHRIGKAAKLHPAKRVLWQVVDGPEEWIGTTISFDLRQEGDWTIVFFNHQGWKEPVEFMHHCSTKWGGAFC
jgi:hypothetical protein